MKVKDLIKELAKYDQNLDVVLSSDAEGNAFYRLRNVADCLVELFSPRNPRERWFPRVAKEQPALVLWPDD